MVTGQTGQPGASVVHRARVASSAEHAFASTELRLIRLTDELFHVVERHHRELCVPAAAEVR